MAEKVVEVGRVGNGSKRTAVQVTVAEYKGKPYADIRTYYLDENDEWAPTKKGVAFHSVDALDRAIEYLAEARKLLAQRLTP